MVLKCNTPKSKTQSFLYVLWCEGVCLHYWLYTLSWCCFSVIQPHFQSTISQWLWLAGLSKGTLEERAVFFQFREPKILLKKLCRLRSSNGFLQFFCTKLILNEITERIILSSEHVSGIYNEEADKELRVKYFDDEQMLIPHVFRLCHIFLHQYTKCGSFCFSH